MKRILVIDDAATVRLYHRSTLEADGYLVEEAVNGIEALEKALRQAFDLYLVDLNMAKMDGYTFCQVLRTEDLAAAPALIVSTDVIQAAPAQACVAGANHFLHKPVRPEDLLTHVRLMLGDAR